MNKLAREASIEDLGDELFRLVERGQGFAFVSDGMAGFNSKKELFGRVRAMLHGNKGVSRKMAAWLRKYDEL